MIVLCSFMDGHHVAELQQRHIVAPSRARASKSNSRLTIWLRWLFLSVMTCTHTFAVLSLNLNAAVEVTAMEASASTTQPRRIKGSRDAKWLKKKTQIQWRVEVNVVKPSRLSISSERIAI